MLFKNYIYLPPFELKSTVAVKHLSKSPRLVTSVTGTLHKISEMGFSKGSS